MKVTIDHRFDHVPFCKEKEVLIQMLVSKKHVLAALGRWHNRIVNEKSIEELCKCHAGGTGPSNELDWLYDFSSKGLTIKYAIFHQIIWDNQMQEYDYEDHCTLDIIWSKKEVIQIYRNQQQQRLF
ncbi:hypothetical protein SAMN04489761_3475 [Tenacibaculum sp. MAR_2009_124]|uniref:hypothetical protein n=1 Tax=Tenacibaculum sp. MAR_2009_124 TaxID=1250059 RepID=UPI0008969ED7|nr:hypothetical protein [Tenacibaculum sp. MAR_2009_124]SEC67754.1 hypothetical protein SAMN04489761_3475 [Tenacibaculum sp. MAR_2009_124]